jgi:hypothetical protein
MPTGLLEYGSIFSNLFYLIPLMKALHNLDRFRFAIFSLLSTIIFSFLYHELTSIGPPVVPDITPWLHIDEFNAQFNVPVIAIFLDLSMSVRTQESFILGWLLFHETLFVTGAATYLSMTLAGILAVINIIRFYRYWEKPLLVVVVILGILSIFCWWYGQTRISHLNHALWHVFSALLFYFSLVLIMRAHKYISLSKPQKSNV